MKSWVFAALVSAGIVIVSLSGACATERKVKVTNGSSSIITELYVSPPEIGDYQANLLGGVSKIQPGASFTLSSWSPEESGGLIPRTRFPRDRWPRCSRRSAESSKRR